MQRGAKALGAKRAAYGIQQWRVWSMEEVRAKMNRQLQDSWMEISTLRGDARLYEEKEREMADRLVELEGLLLEEKYVRGVVEGCLTRVTGGGGGGGISLEGTENAMLDAEGNLNPHWRHPSGGVGVDVMCPRSPGRH